MDGWRDGWIDGWMKGGTEGRTNEEIDGWFKMSSASSTSDVYAIHLASPNIITHILPMNHPPFVDPHPGWVEKCPPCYHDRGECRFYHFLKTPRFSCPCFYDLTILVRHLSNELFKCHCPHQNTKKNKK